MTPFTNPKILTLNDLNPLTALSITATGAAVKG